MVEEGNVLHCVKRERKLSGREKCPGEYVQGKFPDPTVTAPRHNMHLISEVPVALSKRSYNFACIHIFI